MANFSSRLSPLTVSVPVVTDSVSYTPLGSWVTNATYFGKWKRVGQWIELEVDIALSGAPTGILTFTPAQILNGLGLTFDSTAFANLGASSHSIGTFSVNKDATSIAYSGGVKFDGGGTIALGYSTGATTAQLVNATNPITFANGDNVNLRVTLPITGWTANTISGASLNAIVNGGNSYGGDLTIGTNDAFGLNLETNGTTKLSINTAGTHTIGAASGSGQHIARASSSTPFAIDNTTASATNSQLDFKKNGVTGFVIGTDNSSYGTGGFFFYNGTSLTGGHTQAGAWTLGPTSAIGGSTYAGNNIVGKTNGSTVAAGYVGQTVTWLSAPSTQVITTSEADWTNANIVLTPGVWQIFANINCFYATGTAAANTGYVQIKITNTGNTVVQEMDKRLEVLTAAAASTKVESSLGFSFVANVSASTTYKIRVIRVDTAGTGSAQSRNEAGSRSHFYAVRIA
jgi:hypothetical protein